MHDSSRRYALGVLAAGVAWLTAACGGGSSGGDSANQAPVPSIASPAIGSTFKAGDTLAFSGSATDPEDGTLPAGSLTWWAELHHDDHTHPFQQPTGGAGGSVQIPVRGETSDNIFYRFHLRATDSGGRVVETTRDVMPQKAQLTLATQPAGLQLHLDGQPVDAPLQFTGVVGMERDLAAADQDFNGRRYRFDGWSDGGAATHTISTPAAATTYTATFTDMGPVSNQPPTVSLGAASSGTVGTPMSVSASAGDSDGSVTGVEFFDGAASIGSDSTSPYSIAWTPSTPGAHSLTARATDNGGAATTSAAVVVTVGAASGADTEAPLATLTAPVDLASGLAGTLTLTASANDNVGVAGVEFQVDGVTVGSEDTSAPYSASIDSNAYASGQHVIRVRARDAAGNQSGWAVATVRFGGTRAIGQGFTKDDDWVSGLSSATSFVQAPDGRFFIGQQGGAVRVVKNGVLLGSAFHTFANVSSSGERGIIGITLHPSFASNGFVYVHYTTTSGGTHNRISRLVASGDVSTGAETVLVDLPALSSATNHNGGAIHFGVDGKLYVGVGDNANSATSQDLTHPFGKVLRFNDDGSIPGNNPFCTSALQRCAIWARGLRNPFTFAVQPVTGRIHVNDVGQGTWEEINLGAPGANYGWPASEGPDNVTAGITAPLFAYKHSSASPAGSGPGGFFVGFAIAGGAFYPSSGSFPASHRGNYFFADYVSNWVARLDLANGNAAYAFAAVNGSPVDMLVGTDGALYVLTTGGVTRITAP
jgi:glucose/arabinose dehydrogenase